MDNKRKSLIDIIKESAPDIFNKWDGHSFSVVKAPKDLLNDEFTFRIKLINKDNGKIVVIVDPVAFSVREPIKIPDEEKGKPHMKEIDIAPEYTQKAVAIVKASGFQLGSSTLGHIHSVYPLWYVSDDKRKKIFLDEIEKMNEKTDLPYHASYIEGRLLNELK